jgi:hypothetical protein
MIKIWSIKKDNSAAEKKKSKVSAAQIRVQKGKIISLKSSVRVLFYLISFDESLSLPSIMI